MSPLQQQILDEIHNLDLDLDEVQKKLEYIERQRKALLLLVDPRLMAKHINERKVS